MARAGRRFIFLVLFMAAILIESWSVPAFAQNSGITYHGRILRPDGAPLEGASVQFKMQIQSPGAESCLMFEELQTKDLRNSGGVFSITMNDGSGQRTDGGP